MFINTANNVRRELTKAQKAMSYAVMFPLKGNTVEGKNNRLPEVTSSENKMLSQARTILNHRPDSVPEVLSKSIGLNEAYELAKETPVLNEHGLNQYEHDKTKKVSILQFFE